MSLILDALNRARGQSDGAPPPAARRRRPSLLPVLLVLASTAVCLAGGWLLWEREAAPGGPGRKRPADTVPPGRADRPSAGPSARRPAPAVPAPDPDPAVVALYERAAAGAPREPGRSPAAPGKAAPAAPAPVPDADAEADRVDIEAVLARAREELGKPALPAHPAPLLAELSQRQKDRIPTLMYLRHDYRPAGGSSVLLNGETRRVGDAAGPVSIEEILPDSVILRHGDTLFRLRALSSWVNL